MKKIACYLLVSIFVVVWSGCKSQPNPNRMYFISKSVYDATVTIVPVKFSNGATANMLFDTGGWINGILIDSTFARNNPLPAWSRKADQEYNSFVNPWTPEEESYRMRASYFKEPLQIELCGQSLQYDYVTIRDLESQFMVNATGLMGFCDDSTYVWEINFENRYLELHESGKFKMPEGSYVYPLVIGERKDHPFVRFPMEIETQDHQKVVVDQLFLIDTGLGNDVVLLSTAPEINFFRKRSDSVAMYSHNYYRNRYPVSAKVFNDFRIDSMYLYTDEFVKRMKWDAILGINFLKRFNLYFDFKNRTIGFLPIGNYERVESPLDRKYYYSVGVNSAGNDIVTIIADVPHNPYREAGLMKGDEIVAVNGYLPNKRTHKESIAILEARRKELDIIRDGRPMKIVVQLTDDDF